MQSGKYRWTDCVCIVESPWDYISLILLSGLAMYGLLMLAYQTRRKWKKKK